MTKEKILADHGIQTFDTYNTAFENIKKSMSDFAKQEAIEFFNFATMRFTRLKEDKWIEKVSIDETRVMTPENLYQKFIQSKETNNG